MNTLVAPLLLTSLLYLPDAPAPAGAELPARVPPTVASEDGQAWVAVHAGSVWVCWSGDDPHCWQRLDLEPPPNLDTTSALLEPIDDSLVEPLDAASELDLDAPTDTAVDVGNEGLDPRFGFQGSHRLWIAIDDTLWLLERGRRQARWAASQTSPVTLLLPKRPTCGPDGRVPTITGGRLTWTSAKRCALGAPTRGCLRPAISLRPPIGARLRAGLSLARVQRWTHLPAAAEQPATLDRRAGLELLFVIELGFDPTAALRSAQARQQLLASDRWRSVPTVQEGPLAERERAALGAIVCSEVP